MCEVGLNSTQEIQADTSCSEDGPKMVFVVLRASKPDPKFWIQVV